MIKLYGVPVSNNVAKVRYCLNELGLEYELVPINPLAGEAQAEDYLEIAPSGKIPGIDIDGFKLFESNAINRYLANQKNSPLYPKEAKQRATVDAWMDFGAIHIAWAMGRVFFNRIAAPLFGKEKDTSSLNTGLEFLARFLPVVDKQLSGKAYLTGNQMTLADINLLAILDLAEMAQVDLSQYSNLTKWRNGLKKEKFYQKCYKDYTSFCQEQMAQMTSTK